MFSNNKLLIIYIAGLLLFCSCSAYMVTEEEYNSYLFNSKNGLYKEFIEGDFKASILYKPKDLLYRQFLNTNLTQPKHDSLDKIYSKFHFFVLSLTLMDRELLSEVLPDAEIFGKTVEQLHFKLEKSTYLITPKLDTLLPVAYHHSRYFGMGNSSDIIVAFEAPDLLTGYESFDILIEELSLGVGTLRFNFKIVDILDLPKIIIE